MTDQQDISRHSINAAYDKAAKESSGPSDAAACSLLAVRQVPLLMSGGLSTVLATGQPVILIGIDQSHSEKLVSLWHEVVHLLRDAGGYDQDDQDEDDVEATAQRLAAACPEALEWVGIPKANETSPSVGANEKAKS